MSKLRTRLATALLAGALVLTGCTGIPGGSAPEVVRPIGGGQQLTPVRVTPKPGSEPRSIVADFLQNNAASDARHLGARSFLTRDASNRWSDTTATIVSTPQIGNPDSQNQVVVAGELIGTVDASGRYTPSQVIGQGGVTKSFTYTLTKADGEWRIDNLQPGGLLLSYDQFQAYYQQRVVYFYNQDETRLVPDPRFTSLADSGELATWLMTQLASGARPELQSAIATELPTQTDPRRVTATIGGSIKIEIPGASQLKAETRNRLAAQVALTLQPASGGTSISITDGGRAVDIPETGSTSFTSAQFAYATAPATDVPPLYYIDPEGRVVNVDGKPIDGPLGSGNYKLNSVALAKIGPGGTLLTAATAGEQNRQKLYIGAGTAPLKQTSVKGTLSRPAWAPGLDEVWLGAGKALYRVTSGGKVSTVQFAVSGAKVDRVVAVRISPEGSRVALVLRNADGAGQIWLGSIVRAATAVQVSNLTVISPQGVSVKDVAWNDQLKLFAVGRDVGGAANVYELRCDGSLWTPRGIPNLPAAPDSITIAENAVASVSAADTVWVQSGGAWVSPNGGSTEGTNPIYLE